MTRINSAISVKHLTDEHLLAEHREIKRLPYCLQKAINSGSLKKIPQKFSLGNGHVLFFLDKMYYTLTRYKEIHSELIKRGFNVEDYSENWNTIPSTYSNNYTPAQEEYALLKERITKRIMESPKKTWHYYRNTITKEKAIELLNNND